MVKLRLVRVRRHCHSCGQFCGKGTREARASGLKCPGFWDYADPAGWLGARLGAESPRTLVSEVGQAVVHLFDGGDSLD